MKKNKGLIGCIFLLSFGQCIQSSELETTNVMAPLLNIQKKSETDCSNQWTKCLAVKSWLAIISPQSLVCPEGKLKQSHVEMIESLQLNSDPTQTPYLMQLQCLKSRQAQEAYQELLDDIQVPFKAFHKSAFKDEIAANQLWDLLTWHMMHR